MAQKKTYKRSRFSSFVNVQKVMFADFALFKNWWGHLNTIFVLTVGISTNQSLKVQIPGELPGKRGGMSKIPIDWCISNKRQPNINHYVTKLECVHFWGNGVSVIWKYGAADHNNPNINCFTRHNQNHCNLIKIYS